MMAGGAGPVALRGRPEDEAVFRSAVAAQVRQMLHTGDAGVMCSGGGCTAIGCWAPTLRIPQRGGGADLSMAMLEFRLCSRCVDVSPRAAYGALLPREHWSKVTDRAPLADMASAQVVWVFVPGAIN